MTTKINIRAVFFSLALIVMFAVATAALQAKADDRLSPNRSINEYTSTDGAALTSSDYLFGFDASLNNWVKVPATSLIENSYTKTTLNNLTETLTAASNASVINYLSAAAGQDITLPNGETASNKVYPLYVTSAPTGDNALVIHVPTDDTSIMNGSINVFDTTNGLAFRSTAETVSSADTLKFYSSGIVAGDVIYLANISDAGWFVWGETRFESTGSNNTLADVGIEKFQSAVTQP